MQDSPLTHCELNYGVNTSRMPKNREISNITISQDSFDYNTDYTVEWGGSSEDNVF